MTDTPYRTLLRKWDLKPDGEPQKGWMSDVYPVLRRSDDSKAMLKLKGKNDPNFNQQVEALRVMAGAAKANTVAVLESDLTIGAVLIERLLPGQDLTSIGHSGAALVAGTLMRNIRTPVKGPHAFRTTVSLLDEFPRTNGPLEASVADAARETMARLVASEPSPELLHGDLHHGNILRSGNTWAVIDPDPIVGDRAYEAAPFLRNPFSAFSETADLPNFMEWRAKRLAQLIDAGPGRVVEWAFARTASLVVSKWQETGAVHQPWLDATYALAQVSIGRSLSE